MYIMVPLLFSPGEASYPTKHISVVLSSTRMFHDVEGLTNPKSSWNTHTSRKHRHWMPAMDALSSSLIVYSTYSSVLSLNNPNLYEDTARNSLSSSCTCSQTNILCLHFNNPNLYKAHSVALSRTKMTHDIEGLANPQSSWNTHTSRQHRHWLPAMDGLSSSLIVYSTYSFFISQYPQPGASHTLH